MAPSKFYADVLVVGGGMAGVAAAIASARNGIRTMLVERESSLGGLATNGLVNGVVGVVEGICKEVLDRLSGEGALQPQPGPRAFDPEKCKYVLEQMVLEEGAKILYGTTVFDTVVEENIIREVLCHCKSGKISIEAKMVIDTSGDADVAAFAGVPTEAGGNEFMGFNESTTLVFRLGGVNMRK